MLKSALVAVLLIVFANSFAPAGVEASAKAVLDASGAYPATGHVATTQEGACGCRCHD